MSKKMTFIEEARRKQILEIAQKLMIERGYTHTSIDTIAGAAGVTKSVIYYHYGGKAELVGAVLESLLQEMLDYRLERANREESAVAKLRAYIEANLDFLLNRQQRKYFSVIFEAGIELNSQGGRNPWSAENNSRSFKIIIDILRQGLEEGVFTPMVPEHMAPVIQGAIDGIVLHAYGDPENVDWHVCRDTLLAMVYTHLGVDRLDQKP